VQRCLVHAMYLSASAAACLARVRYNKLMFTFTLGTCAASRFDSNSKSAILIRFDSKVMGRFENFRIGRACPLLVVVKLLKPLTPLSGTVHRLASSMSDHTPVLFNMFEEWNEKSVVPHAHLFCFIFN